MSGTSCLIRLAATSDFLRGCGWHHFFARPGGGVLRSASPHAGHSRVSWSHPRGASASSLEDSTSLLKCGRSTALDHSKPAKSQTYFLPKWLGRLFVSHSNWAKFWGLILYTYIYKKCFGDVTNCTEINHFLYIYLSCWLGNNFLFVTVNDVRGPEKALFGPAKLSVAAELCHHWYLVPLRPQTSVFRLLFLLLRASPLPSRALTPCQGGSDAASRADARSSGALKEQPGGFCTGATKALFICSPSQHNQLIADAAATAAFPPGVAIALVGCRAPELPGPLPLCPSKSPCRGCIKGDALLGPPPKGGTHPGGLKREDKRRSLNAPLHP